MNMITPQSAAVTGSVVSKDGTKIVYERVGTGPALILVAGALNDRKGRASGTPLAAQLAENLTVYAYDRRGRGDSGDTLPYAVAREVEDIEALIAEAGGSAFIYGMSSGGALSLEAAASGLPITKIAVYEPPFNIHHKSAVRSKAYTAELNALLGEGRRGDAAARFMTMVGVPTPMIEGMRQSPMWPAFETIAPTLAYDSAVMQDIIGGMLPADRIASITVPTLAIAGGASPEWMRIVAKAVADAMTNGEFKVLEGQTHDVAPVVLAPVLAEFFSA